MKSLKNKLVGFGILTALVFGGCEVKLKSKPYQLPNGTNVSLDYESFGRNTVNVVNIRQDGRTLIRDWYVDKDLENGARMQAKVDYIGIVKDSGNASYIVNQSTADNWGDENTGNNYANLPQKGIVIKVSLPDGKNKLLVINQKKDINPNSLLDLINKGDDISFPTVRFNRELGKGKEFLILDRQIESFSPEEIRLE